MGRRGNVRNGLAQVIKSDAICNIQKLYKNMQFDTKEFETLQGFLLFHFKQLFQQLRRFCNENTRNLMENREMQEDAQDWNICILGVGMW